MKKKSVGVTGASGFLGKALLKRLIKLGVKDIIAVAHSEQKGVMAMKEFPTVKWIIGDIRDEEILSKVVMQDIVFHLAAQKHIPIGEQFPKFTVDTNILATMKLINYCDIMGRTLVGVSTDKACNPETIYGMSKYFMERMFWETNRESDFSTCCACRYGNVIGSSGSVFEIWDKLGKEGKTLQITNPDMTRFYFTVDDAVDTLIETLRKKYRDKPYIPKMKAIRMGDALELFTEYYGVKSKVIGNRGNEKLHEDLDTGINSNNVKKYTKREFKKILKSLGLLK